MNRNKRTELLRKKNIELTSQLAELHQKLDTQSDAKQLIAKLQELEQEWINAIQELNKRRDAYDNLIADMQAIKKIMIETGYKIHIPWYKKLIIKLKSH